jgi:hypothetical protein
VKHNFLIGRGHAPLFDRIDVSTVSGMFEDSEVEGGKKANGLKIDRDTLGCGDGLLGCLSDLAKA